MDPDQLASEEATLFTIDFISRVSFYFQKSLYIVSLQ